ncbi:DUF6550 family protein [Anaerocolumna aminovalerica]|uniref:DUF6550 family protein n=1 Tax=Anaerocolumna aminovalerica TaxID=1527 RepID=UPI000BE46DA2|nr:DUF6550 family protein [Anaerocolumna aminovalerica]
MKFTDKTKKRLTIAGLGMVCVALIIAISSQFKTEKPKDEVIQPPQTVSGDITPGTDIQPTSSEPTKEPEVSVIVIDPTKPSEVSVSPVDPTKSPEKKAGTDTGDSSGTEQKIQEEVKKPTEPPKEVKTDPTKKPDGEKVTSVTPVEHDKVKKPENNTSPSTPKSGDKKDGKIYVPGFGWIEDNGGGGSGTTAMDMYENGNKIGSMD